MSCSDLVSDANLDAKFEIDKDDGSCTRRPIMPQICSSFVPETIKTTTTTYQTFVPWNEKTVNLDEFWCEQYSLGFAIVAFIVNTYTHFSNCYWNFPLLWNWLIYSLLCLLLISYDLISWVKNRGRLSVYVNPSWIQGLKLCTPDARFVFKVKT